MRARDEASIKRTDPKMATAFEDALATLAFRHKLDWFTDEQIAEIRAEMTQKKWRETRRTLRLNLENRKRRAA